MWYKDKRNTNTQKHKEMKANTLQNRIDSNLRTKGGVIAARYANVEKVLLGNRYHGAGYSGRGRYTSKANGDHFAVIEGLRLIGVDFVEGNDAPRGGWSGQYVELSPKGKRQVAEWAKQRRAEIAEAEAKKQADIAAKKARRAEAIKNNLAILNENPDTVAEYFPEQPETFTTAMGKEINTSNIRNKRHQLAHALHVLNDRDFQAAFAFYFLKSEYISVQYGNGIAERIEINFDDVK